MHYSDTHISWHVQQEVKEFSRRLWILKHTLHKRTSALLLMKKTFLNHLTILTNTLHTEFHPEVKTVLRKCIRLEKCQGILMFRLCSQHSCYIFAATVNCLPLLPHDLQRQHLPLKSDVLLRALSPTSTQHSSKVTRSGT